MIRSLTSMLWLIAALALGFEAMAQPCDMRADMQATSGHEMMADMPCHDGMMMPTPDNDQAPKHHDMSCCCAALLGNGVTVAAIEVTQPTPGLTQWSTPLPDSALSYLAEFDPPPPRA
jgi:hypothetical protein